MLSNHQMSFLAGNLGMCAIAFVRGTPLSAGDILGTTVVTAFIMFIVGGLKRETVGG